MGFDMRCHSLSEVNLPIGMASVKKGQNSNGTCLDCCPKAKIPTVNPWSLAAPKANESINHLYLKLNETRIDYPGADLKLFFKSVA
jgi:hypothetical protein